MKLFFSIFPFKNSVSLEAKFLLFFRMSENLAKNRFMEFINKLYSHQVDEKFFNSLYRKNLQVGSH